MDCLLVREGKTLSFGCVAVVLIGSEIVCCCYVLWLDAAAVGPSGYSALTSFTIAATTSSPRASHSFLLAWAYERYSSEETPKTPHSLSFFAKGMTTSYEKVDCKGRQSKILLISVIGKREGQKATVIQMMQNVL